MPLSMPTPVPPPEAAPTRCLCTFSRPGPSDETDLAALTATEWLLTAGNGGFAMGTAAGIPTRRYHGLLVASLRPPVNRIVALAAIAETVTAGDGEARFDLASFNFAGEGGTSSVHPMGYRFLVSFEKDAAAGSVRWHNRCNTAAGTIDITKTLHLLRDHPSAIVQYAVNNATGTPASLALHPLAALRDFHALLLRDINPGRFSVTPAGAAGVAVAAQGETLALAAESSATIHFNHNEQWWYNFSYAIEASRGYDHLDDLFSPGVFTATLPPGR
ncbi:MAG: glycogen debranching enzyme N-terminal domain-containing protein, partial [Phycisphaerales bacterium]|nr:glycogen debranching enzyme N-terminal domain-containing protein [Phycisphaerales bacterium]